MRRALTPSRSVTRLDNLMWASSKRDSNWFCSRTRSHLNWYFLRVTVRHSRCSASGTKLKVSSWATSRFTSRSASRKSVLRPRRPRLDSACAKCNVPDFRLAPSRFSQIGFQYRSSAPHTGFQYWAVDFMAARARSRRGSHGVDCPVLEQWRGRSRTVLLVDRREECRRKAEVRNVASRAGAIQSRAARTQERFRRCRTPGEAAGGPGIGSEFCARSRAAFVADGNAQEVPVEVRSGAAAEPIGVSFGRGPHQVVQPGHRSTGSQRSAHAEGPG